MATQKNVNVISGKMKFFQATCLVFCVSLAMAKGQYLGQPEFCQLPADPSPCLAYMPHWFYDNSTRSCKAFVYGGCKGNANRFGTLEGCLRVCGDGDGDNNGGCKAPPKTGPCRAINERWYFEPKTGECKSFNYGGCEANGNNYMHKGECELTCKWDELVRYPQ